MSIADVTPGVIVEDKRWTASVHYRLADPAVVPALSAHVADIARQLGLRVTVGKEVLELRPLGVGDQAQRKEFALVMKAFEQAMAGIDHIDLSAIKVVRILAFATAGRLRAIRKLLVRSVELVAKEARAGRPAVVNLAILERAFLEVIFKKAKPEQNPFSKKFRGTPLIKAGEPFAPSGR